MIGQVRFDYYDVFVSTITLDFVNTASESDGLSTVAEVDEFLGRHTDMSRIADAEQSRDLDIDRIAALYRKALEQWTVTAADVAELAQVRSLLRGVFESARTDPGAAIQALNGALTRYRAVPRISAEHDEPHLHFEAAEDGIVHWLAVTMLMGLVMFICNGNAARLGVCASTSCQRAFIDRSKNSQKKYCSDVCAHRESVAAYRARQKHGTSTD